MPPVPPYIGRFQEHVQDGEPITHGRGKSQRAKLTGEASESRSTGGGVARPIQ